MPSPVQATDSIAQRILVWADNSLTAQSLPLRAVHTMTRLVLITMREFGKNDLTLRSAALTYTILLSLVPILAMSTAVIKGLGGGDQLREVAYNYLDTLEVGANTPIFSLETVGLGEDNGEKRVPAGLTAHLRDAVGQIFDYVDKINFTTLGSLGVAGIMVSVVLVFGNIELALNTIWHVGKGRSIMRKIADYITLIVLMPISISVALTASAFISSPTLAAQFQLFIPLVWLQTLILKLVPVFAIALSFYVIYIFFPNTKVKNLPALLGALLAAILWFAVQNTYIRLQIGVSNYNAIYGSFATLPLFLVWMYLGWLFVLVGAQVAFACQHLHNYRLLPTPPQPARRLSASFDIMDLIQRGFTEGRTIAREDLAELHHLYGAKLIDEVTDQLVAGELLCLVEGSERLLPAGPADVIGHSRIIEVILGTLTPDSPGGAAAREYLQPPVQELPPGLSTAAGRRQEGESST